ncbi:MAG TPA: biotin/lipoyl-containing protein [Candidatus Thermoplasmatota archaeon]|nr:biotin/lipoyl-containing protein [Candidatus Thermoplasmatota archaeon]
MHVVLEIDGETHDLWIEREDERVAIEAGDKTFSVEARRRGKTIEVAFDGRTFHVETRGPTHARIDGHLVEFRVVGFSPGGGPGRHRAGAAGPARVRTPMPGRVVAVKVREGDAVQKGQVLLVLEAMKMQNEVHAPTTGRVAKVHASEGGVVEANAVLVDLEG